MLRGRNDHTIDAKGRIALPIGFREQIARKHDVADRFVITRHLKQRCLEVWPIASWETFEERLAEQPRFDPNLEIFRRVYVGSAREASLDPQGRLQIPLELRRDVGLEKDAVWIGMTNVAELWAKEAYEAHDAEFRGKIANGEMGDLMAKLAELRF